MALLLPRQGLLVLFEPPGTVTVDMYVSASSACASLGSSLRVRRKRRRTRSGATYDAPEPKRAKAGSRPELPPIDASALESASKASDVYSIFWKMHLVDVQTTKQVMGCDISPSFRVNEKHPLYGLPDEVCTFISAYVRDQNRMDREAGEEGGEEKARVAFGDGLRKLEVEGADNAVSDVTYLET